MAVGSFLLALMAIAAIFPDSARSLRQSLLDALDRAHAELTPSRLSFWIVLGVAMYVFGHAFVVDLAWLMALDVATFFEVWIAVTLTGAASHLQNARGPLLNAAHAWKRRIGLARAAFLRTLRTRWRHAPRRRFRPKKADEDEYDASALALA